MKWTFETQRKPSGGWRISAQRFDDPATATAAAAEWLKVCAENGELVAVRLCKMNGLTKVV